MSSTASKDEHRAFWKRCLPRSWTKSKPLIPVLRFNGAIGMSSPFRPGLSLATAAASIDKAFAMRGAKAVAIQINSPGGSPVQSTLIFKRVRALAEEKNLKVYVFAEDVAASGGYMLACAGDEIYADESSIIGSIGVISASFGFTGREGKLNKPDKALFTGDFWTGQAALDLGLVDGISDLRTKMREVYGDGVRFKLVAPATSWFRRKKTVAVDGGFDLGALSGELTEGVISAIEARALWARFGL